jgi:hypothetical protein
MVRTYTVEGEIIRQAHQASGPVGIVFALTTRFKGFEELNGLRKPWKT